MDSVAVLDFTKKNLSQYLDMCMPVDLEIYL